MDHRLRASCRDDDARRSARALRAHDRALAVVSLSESCKRSRALSARLGFLPSLTDADCTTSFNACDVETPRWRAMSSIFRIVAASSVYVALIMGLDIATRLGSVRIF